MQFATPTNIDDDLKIIKDGRSYTLPAKWSLSDAGAYEFNNKVEDRAFAHGGDVVGDGMIKGRTIKVEFVMRGLTEQEHDEMVNRAYRYFYQKDYQLYCGRLDRVFNVAGLSKIGHKYQKGFKQRMSTITVSLLLGDPFRYQGQESKVVYEFKSAAVQSPMVIYNLGSVDTPITLRFIPTGKVSSNITVWHAETQSQMQLNDAMLILPCVTTVNSKEGTVWRDSANAINTFGGQFLSAIPGKNTYYYTGGAGTVEIYFTNRWFV